MTLTLNRTDGLGLLETLGVSPLHEAVAMLSHPAWFRFARWSDGRLTDAGNDDATVQGVFEARIFSPAGELRWLARPGGPPVAALLTRDTGAGGDPWPAQPIGELPRKYLLWGTVRRQHDGWAQLAERRVGSLMVPFTDPVDVGRRLRIAATEIVTADDHGNATVQEEILSHLEAC